jgi:translation elongation factor EF-G
MGAIIGDLNQRRGQVQDVNTRGAKRVVQAHVAAAQHVRLLDQGCAA